MSTKQEIKDGVAYKYSSDWISRLETRKHWEYYWFQQHLMEDLLDKSEDEVLEIGVGSGFAASYMRSKGVCVTTLDIDPDKKPDIVANVVSHDFSGVWDCLMAFEILEHIPYGEFEKIINKVPSFVKKYAFISLPRNVTSVFSGNITLPKLSPLRWDFVVKRRRVVEPNHHWEMDYGGYTTASIEQSFENAGLSVARKISHRHITFYALKVKSGSIEARTAADRP